MFYKLALRQPNGKQDITDLDKEYIIDEFRNFY
jgi:hypothetical protein